MGTVVLLAAAGHLAKVGVAAYAEEMVKAIVQLKQALPTGSFVANGLIFISLGSKDPSLIGAVADIANWLVSLDRGDVAGTICWSP